MRDRLPKLYPLKFKPQLLEKVWGGNQLAQLFGKEAKGNIGESWEISGVENHVSIVANGALNGRLLTQLINSYGAELLGHKVVTTFGAKFPLLFKFIDAAQDLSVQLHPGDEIARARHNSFGKTEMWYILAAEEQARLILGFKEKMDKETYQKSLSEGTLTELLHSEPVQKGDAFFIPPGTVHAIGAGVVLAEIQQTSDITYRIYDWDRPDMDGKMRELHTNQALDVITFERTEAKLQFEEKENETSLVCSAPYFETNVLKLSKNLQKNTLDIDSFIVYMCVEGSAEVQTYEGISSLEKGETVLVPATISEIEISTKSATLLEVYVP